MDITSIIQCNYCKSFFKTQQNLIKHEYFSKTCKEIRKNIKYESIKLLKNKNNDLETELNTYIENNIKKINIQLEFQKQIDEKNKKLEFELQYQKDLENKIKKTQEINLEIEQKLKKILEDNEKKLKEQLETNKKINLLKINLENDIKKILNNNNDQLHENLKNRIKELLNSFNLNGNEICNNNIINISNVFDPIIETIYGDIVIKIIDFINNFLSNNKITNENIMYIIIELMKFIEIYDIENVDKKEIVIYSLKKYINENINKVEEYNNINILINKYLNHIIDIIISIDSKKNKIRNKFIFKPFLKKK